jgi:integrase
MNWPPNWTASWTNGISDELADKLAGVVLMQPRNSRTLGEFLDTYFEQRKGDSKPTTLANIQRVMIDLRKLFPDSKPLREFTPEDAHKLKAYYLDPSQKLASATTFRRLKMARMFFTHAMKLEFITRNPFADVRGTNDNPAHRRYFLSVEDTAKLVDAANPTWRTIIALARYGGLRCPSEVLLLRWENVNLATGRMTVTSPKTERNPTKPIVSCRFSLSCGLTSKMPTS